MASRTPAPTAPSSTPDPTASASTPSMQGSAAVGDHPIKSIKRRGYMNVKGARTLVGVPEWEDTLVIIKDTNRLEANAGEADDVRPLGLLPGDYKLVKAFDEDDVTGYTRKYTCRYCGIGLSCRASGIRHEQKCNAEGAPGHVCVVPPCTTDCIGPSVWTRPPDGRSDFVPF